MRAPYWIKWGMHAQVMGGASERTSAGPSEVVWVRDRVADLSDPDIGFQQSIDRLGFHAIQR